MHISYVKFFREREGEREREREREKKKYILETIIMDFIVSYSFFVL